MTIICETLHRSECGASDSKLADGLKCNRLGLRTFEEGAKRDALLTTGEAKRDALLTSTLDFVVAWSEKPIRSGAQKRRCVVSGT